MDECLRVLHVLGALNRGGAETMIMNLYRKINRKNVQFDFVIHTESICDYEEEIESLGGKIYRIPRYTGGNHLQYIRAWNVFLKAHPEYKVIHGHARSTASLYLGIAKKHGLVTIAHSHNTSSGKGISSLVKNTLQYPIRYIADYLFACSETAGAWLFGRKIGNSNYRIVKNAIESEKFTFNKNSRERIREELNVNGKLVIGHIGRFQSQKNHSFLIEIFKAVHDINRNVILLLIGEGELRKSITDKVNMLGLSENVIFMGTRTDIPDLMQAIDLFLFPSLYEGLPLTLIEAQAAGLKCIISSSITSEVEITNELVEYISLEESPANWAKKILNNCNGYDRKDTYEHISKSGYDAKQNAEWMERFYIFVQRGK